MNGQQQPTTKQQQQQQVTNQMRMPGFLGGNSGALPGDAAPSNGTGVSRQQSAPAQPTQASSQPINANLDVSLNSVPW